MSNPTNKKLYGKIKAEADLKYKKPSLYKSGWITREYQKRGGKYTGKKPNGVSTWMAEGWVQVEPYVKEGLKIKCGVGKHPKACRPTKRINKNTPLTIQEVMNLHSSADILKAVRQKHRDMDKRINWKTLKVS